MRVEERVSQKLRSTRTREAILGALQFGGLLALTVLVPNAAGVLVKHVTRGSRARVRSAVYRLEKQELIRFETKNGKKFARITLKGQEYLSDKLVRKTRTGRWDGKWRVVIFDISQERRALRRILRHTLLRIGFMKLQQSVWIYPYECEELVTLLKSKYRIGRDVLYMVVDELEYDSPVRRHFGLK